VRNLDDLNVLAPPPHFCDVVVFLETLESKDPLPLPLVDRLASVYGLLGVRNSEIRFHWHLVALLAGYEPVLSDVVAFITEQGRMKYVRPLYRHVPWVHGKARGHADANALRFLDLGMSRRPGSWRARRSRATWRETRSTRMRTRTTRSPQRRSPRTWA